MIQRLRNVSGTPTNTSCKTNPRLSWGVINALMSTNTRYIKDTRNWWHSRNEPERWKGCKVLFSVGKIQKLWTTKTSTCPEFSYTCHVDVCILIYIYTCIYIYAHVIYVFVNTYVYIYISSLVRNGSRTQDFFFAKLLVPRKRWDLPGIFKDLGSCLKTGLQWKIHRESLHQNLRT